MRTKLLLGLIFLLTCSLYGQKHLTFITYNMGIPTGNLTDFTGLYSWGGLGIESRIFTDKNISVGAKLGWNLFEEKSERVITGKNWTVSGTNIRNFNSFPLMLNSHFYYGDKNSFVTYLGLNAGMYYITQNFNISVTEIFVDHWHFGLAPEVGFIIPFSNFAMSFDIEYNYAFDAGTSFNGSEDNSFSYVGINIGFILNNRY